MVLVVLVVGAVDVELTVLDDGEVLLLYHAKGAVS